MIHENVAFSKSKFLNINILLSNISNIVDYKLALFSDFYNKISKKKLNAVIDNLTFF